MGKGSRPRPFEVDSEKFASNWDKIFGKKDIKEEQKSNSNEPKESENKKNK